MEVPRFVRRLSIISPTMQRRPKPPIHSLARSGRYRQTTNHGQVFFWFHVSETQKEFLSNRAELSRAGSSERAAGGTRALEWTGMWVGSPGRPGDQSINSTERMGAGSRDRWGSSTPGLASCNCHLVIPWWLCCRQRGIGIGLAAPIFILPSRDPFLPSPLHKARKTGLGWDVCM